LCAATLLSSKLPRARCSIQSGSRYLLGSADIKLCATVYSQGEAMLIASTHAEPEIEKLIKSLLVEEFSFDQTERRTLVREHFVRPISITIAGQPTFIAFSRNFTASGIGLISNRPINESELASLEIYRLNDQPAELLAECRWCKSYGGSWYLSGWKLLKIKK
jgi:hypothetical protein